MCLSGWKFNILLSSIYFNVSKLTISILVKTVRSGRIQTILMSSDEEDDVKPTLNGDGSHLIEEVKYCFPFLLFKHKKY